MTDEEKLTLIQKYEELPAEEFKEECFEDLKKFAFDKDDTVKTFTASVLSHFVNTAKQKEAIEILLQLCHEENELVRTEAYDAIGCYCEKSVVKVLKKLFYRKKMGWQEVMQLIRGFMYNSTCVQTRQKLLDI